jgi:hypothetical protein
MPKGAEYLAVEFSPINPMTDLIVVVETSLWVEKEIEICYLGNNMMLIPENEKSDAMIRFPLGKAFFETTHFDNWPTIAGSLSVVLRLLSALTWKYKVPFTCNGLLTVLTGLGVSTHYNNIRVINNLELNFLSVGNDKQTNLALALYREAITSNSIPMRFLSFAKIQNIKYNGKSQIIKAFNEIVKHLIDDKVVKRTKDLELLGKDVGSQLYISGRCAVAHANSEPIIDPDDPTDLQDLILDMPLIKGVAEYIIEHELNLQILPIVPNIE